MVAVDYRFYSRVYGGGLSEVAFSDCLPMAESHVKWLCSVKGACANSNAYKRAVCAACEAFGASCLTLEYLNKKCGHPTIRGMADIEEQLLAFLK